LFYACNLSQDWIRKDICQISFLSFFFKEKKHFLLCHVILQYEALFSSEEGEGLLTIFFTRKMAAFDVDL